MSNTCTCTTPLDTHLPRSEVRCPTCGKAFASTDATTGIQGETPLPQLDVGAPFDDVVHSIQIKSQAARAVKVCICVLVVFALVVLLLGITFNWLILERHLDGRYVALAQVKGPLTNAVHEYFLKHNGVFPENLEALFVQDKFGGPYVETPDALIDPWGNRYQYDINGPRNNGTRPDIWTVAPDGTIIGNWSNVKAE